MRALSFWAEARNWSLDPWPGRRPSVGSSLLPGLRAAVLLGASGYARPGAGIGRRPGLRLALELCPQSLPPSSDRGRAERPSGDAGETRLRRPTEGGLGEQTRRRASARRGPARNARPAGRRERFPKAAVFRAAAAATFASCAPCSQTAVPRSPKFKTSLLNKSRLREAIDQNAHPRAFMLEREQVNLIRGLQPTLN